MTSLIILYCQVDYAAYILFSTRPPSKVLILKALIVSSLTASWPSLATCILAARAPLELSSLVIALCDHQQKMRQHNTTMYRVLFLTVPTQKFLSVSW